MSVRRPRTLRRQVGFQLQATPRCIRPKVTPRLPCLSEREEAKLPHLTVVSTNRRSPWARGSLGHHASAAAIGTHWHDGVCITRGNEHTTRRSTRQERHELGSLSKYKYDGDFPSVARTLAARGGARIGLSMCRQQVVSSIANARATTATLCYQKSTGRQVPQVGAHPSHCTAIGQTLAAHLGDSDENEPARQQTRSRLPRHRARQTLIFLIWPWTKMLPFPSSELLGPFG